ncbi:DUF2892 domain-containing protein [Alicyclobacillus mali]|uniref:DUF2892 domain-containing protein n=1 Tax=Alicyclobacillus mali (ex Roth et al. 2021) TaxID=1123961 RepID=A0ABS0F2M3_9BACL|nr:DUF2892 domain-containing protein [Alicyclobacillus mali (ex Roth et al. 2021)]MBF8377548.1 DUF2892 domain-containing protein [Alicyclobacillus mali (ex Roth et al. 2021)]MCL6487510.1 DUF2892 domain-containing protein [Alicyclobacillus mali (ex Roth et al. 2021)]
MQRNIHPADRYLRLAAGVASLSSAVYGRRQSAFTRALLAGFGAMKIAEAISGYCPIKASVERMPKSGEQAARASQSWMRQASAIAQKGVERLVDQAQGTVQQAADRVKTSDTPIPDEVAEFLVEGSKREPSDEDNA